MKRIIVIIFCLLAVCSNIAMAKVVGVRHITLINQCDHSVWFGFSGGSTGTRCETNNDCVTGSSCIQTGNVKNCFWDNPKPDNGYELSKSGGKTTVIIPEYDTNKTDKVWSGAIAGRTGCENGSCETAACSKDAAGCEASRGFSQPATQAEFTLSRSADFYDVEVINGFNIPVSMAPTIPGGTSDNPYQCGSPGAVKNTTTSAGVCSWKMNPPSNDYVWVERGGAACSNDSDCTQPDRCGLSFTPGLSKPFKKTCGKQLGYWTANQICGIDHSYVSPSINCSERLPSNPSLTLTQLYQCASIPSCYSDHAKDDCCGCVNWWERGIDVPAAFTTRCVSNNPFWTQNVEPSLKWLKEACPTAYTYPYDDTSSTFTCTQKIQAKKMRRIIRLRFARSRCL